jgi:two-component system sensor histidine kinase KdpD
MPASSPNDGVTIAQPLPAFSLSTNNLASVKLTGRRRFVVEFCLASWVVGLLTFCAFVLRLELSTAGFLYLLTVVVVAQTCGLRQATLTSILGVACLDYFIVPPLFSFDFGAPQNLVALVTFEFCALIVSRLSAREKRHASEASSRRRSMEKLFSISRGILEFDLHSPPGPQISVLIYGCFDLECVAVYDAELASSASTGACSSAKEEVVRSTYLDGIDRDDPPNRACFRVLRADHRLTGALYLRGAIDPLSADALASLTSIALERHRSFEKKSQAEAARQSEQMRTAVLDALAHAFKTPLTAIRAASEGLLEIGSLTESQLDLATLVDEQAQELNDLATRLLQTARLDSERWSVLPEQIAVSGLISDVLSEQQRRLNQHPVEVSISDSSLATEGDRGLLATIVGQFVDNAAKYSPPGSPIRVAAEGHHSQVVISVHNHGAPIRLEDRERIFERFYRCPETKDIAPGTGIGLSIARKAAEAHHGHVWVISGEREGNTFFVSLPQSAALPASSIVAPESAATARRVN